MEISDLKKYISEDANHIIKILDFYNFHKIRVINEGEIRCATPNGTNGTSVSIKVNENLFTRIYSDGEPFKGDLISACMHVADVPFKNVLANISNLMGVTLDGRTDKASKRVRPMERYKKYLKKKDRGVKVENKMFDRRILNDFVLLPHADLFQEAISPKVAKMFEIGFDPRNNRIIFPHYDWYEESKIVGIQGRIVGMTTEQAKLLDVPKYWNYLGGYKKQYNLYGWPLAKENISESKMLIIFEGEKSVLKHFSFLNGKGYSVALGSHEISQEQVDFILKNTPTDCEIVIAFDKDVMVKDENFIKQNCRRFSIFRKTSYIIDRIDNGKILKETDSPIDNGYKVFKYLLSERELVRNV